MRLPTSDRPVEGACSYETPIDCFDLCECRWRRRCRNLVACADLAHTGQSRGITGDPIVTAKVGVSDMPLVKVGLGTVAAYNTVNMHSQVTGTIQKIGLVEGQTVQPGNLIAQLDPRPFQAALQQAQANLDRDEAHLANANSLKRPVARSGIHC